MKTKSPLLTAIGVLALFVLVAFPSSSALATGHCHDVIIYYEYGGPTGLLIDMECDFPSGTTIFYTTDGSAPTHSGGSATGTTGIFYGDIPQTYGTRVRYRAIAYKAGYLDSANIADETIANPPD